MPVQSVGERLTLAWTLPSAFSNCGAAIAQSECALSAASSRRCATLDAAVGIHEPQQRGIRHGRGLVDRGPETAVRRIHVST